ncbi:hypothetical protein T4E_4897 [Trichinella pseudospiralis]|uniref:Uncharacterized protein n=1 Tax=Trichinella pseudospiralis TaxID=6337 RepID=A0A0V0YBK0_TRIPS|nr:hypothetical protein T4E_4897 [Trichinella pseudospiralis]
MRKTALKLSDNIDTITISDWTTQHPYMSLNQDTLAVSIQLWQLLFFDQLHNKEAEFQLSNTSDIVPSCHDQQPQLVL